MKLYHFIGFFLIVSIYSCQSDFTFEYPKKKQHFDTIRRCILSHYSTLFDSSTSVKSKSLYEIDLKEMGCGQILNLVSDPPIEFVEIRKDSTVLFYSSKKGLLKEKQKMLVFSPNRALFLKELPRGVSLIHSFGDTCLELEQIISLAD